MDEVYAKHRSVWLRVASKIFKFRSDKQTYVMGFIHLGWKIAEFALYYGYESPAW
jgi:hypothetical protein